MSREFFDTAERGLNAESDHATAWSNFGYWRTAQRYPDAAEDLACLLADAIALAPADQVLDLGFGMGEQLRLWHSAYGVRSLVGVNPSASQNAVARTQPGVDGFQLLQARVEDTLPQPNAPSFDKVLALDCAYHFSPRSRTLQAIADSLRPGGSLGLTDLYLPRPPGLVASASLRAMCALSRIPYSNLMGQEAYRRQLAEAGLELHRFEDITADVFEPFARWWRRYTRQHRLPLRDRLKFAATASFLAEAAARETLGYALVVAKRKVASPSP